MRKRTFLNPSYFLHGYMAASDTVFCFGVKEWLLATDAPVSANLRNLRPALKVVGWERAMECRGNLVSFHFDLNERDRFYIVENDGTVQRPNGPIVWRWENGVVVDKSAATA